MLENTTNHEYTPVSKRLSLILSSHGVTDLDALKAIEETDVEVAHLLPALGTKELTKCAEQGAQLAAKSTVDDLADVLLTSTETATQEAEEMLKLSRSEMAEKIESNIAAEDPTLKDEIANNYGSFTPIIETILGKEALANAGHLFAMPTFITQIQLGRAKLAQYKQILALAGKYDHNPELQRLLQAEATVLLYEGTGILAAASNSILGTTETIVGGLGKVAQRRSRKGLAIIAKALPFIEILGLGLAATIETGAIVSSAHNYYDKEKMLEAVNKLEAKMEKLYPAMQLINIEEDPSKPLPDSVKQAKAQMLEEYRLANNLCEYFSNFANTEQKDALLTIFTSGTNAGLAVTGLLSTLGVITVTGGLALVGIPIVMSVIALGNFIHDQQQAKTAEQKDNFNKTYGDFANTPEGMFAALYFIIKKEMAEKEASDKLTKEKDPNAPAHERQDNKYVHGLTMQFSAHAHNPVHQKDANLDNQPFSNYILPLLGFKSAEEFIKMVDHGLELAAVHMPAAIEKPDIQSPAVQTAFPHIIRKSDPEARQKVRDLAAQVELTYEIVGNTTGDENMKKTLSDLMLIQNGYDIMIKRCDFLLDNLDENDFNNSDTIESIRQMIDNLTAMRQTSLMELDQCLRTFDGTQLNTPGAQKVAQPVSPAKSASLFESAMQYVNSFFEKDTKTTLAETNDAINQLAQKMGVKFPADMDPQKYHGIPSSSIRDAHKI